MGISQQSEFSAHGSNEIFKLSIERTAFKNLVLIEKDVCCEKKDII